MVVNHLASSSEIQVKQRVRVKPDVAIFLRGLYGGGAEKAMLNLARGFIDRGLQVDLVLARAAGVYLEQVQPEIRVVDLKAEWMPSSLPKLTRYLQQTHPTTMLAALHYPCEIALWAKRLARVSTRIIVSEHNHLSLEAQRIPQRSVQFTPTAARLFYPWADGIVAVSQGVADDLAEITRLNRDRIQVVYNPIVLPELFTQAQEPVTHPWFKPDQPPVVLAVGRLYPQKDFSTLIHAFAQVRRIRPARLVILGDGPERERLTTLVEELGLTEDVALLGFVQNPYAYMAKAAVFVLSSAWEGLGNVLVEALAVGTPVVSTNCESGPAEILAQGKYGVLTPVGDDSAIASAIIQTLSSPARQVDPQWLKQFTLETCTQQYLDVLGICDYSSPTKTV
ncbi:group 1 glycosyl transferase [Leptolyngbya boryana NIES-2135]|jgi:glycosyltransferase involved in cell wall biosynthesis|uniref:Group 1 glycosyl transferase n=1 Tax=Leptolyngbya boryana NIES-2135 TaxID=1973484 RepID=A0A1Z4JCS2_LEPBY|nr:MULTISPECIES: glycosyltransferase [Leptolyngbya]BAY54559.1 group 1 glycosyl transferase [Leptolyngbya boryana NIES-2135]MBD2365552.1 glycosyltransferase [Leptolyngbya sp. FACHB-161]MBD2371732.1 glycosyltransferase [Leptolyngbya sp. FACHB-238]MBD2396157.1 glycosyltransferase [Leptolyngbya sp. FACHB-239]MBD2402680.1 glycosyltransferase [Leptolyngbya sp. FACHB-402]